MVCCAAVRRASCAARGDEGCAALGGHAVRRSLLHCAESFRAFCSLMRLPALMRISAVFLAARIFLKIALVKIVQLYPCGFLQPARFFCLCLRSAGPFGGALRLPKARPLRRERRGISRRFGARARAQNFLETPGGFCDSD